MVKPFDDREKEIIRQALFEKGRELFAQFGLKKTSISDLTQAVKIAQGSFYNFFDSKEELYFEILEQEEEQLKSGLLAKYFGDGQITRDRFKGLLKEGLNLIDKSTFLKRLYMAEEYDLLVRKLPPEKLAAHQKKDMGDLLPMFAYLQQQGLTIEAKPEVVVGVIHGLFLLTLHKKEIGEAVYQESIELMVDLIIDGLITEKGV